MKKIKITAKSVRQGVEYLNFNLSKVRDIFSFEEITNFLEKKYKGTVKTLGGDIVVLSRIKKI